MLKRELLEALAISYDDFKFRITVNTSFLGYLIWRATYKSYEGKEWWYLGGPEVYRPGLLKDLRRLFAESGVCPKKGERK